MSSSDKNVHVVPNSDRGGWDAKRESASRSSGHFDTKEEAVDYGRSIAKSSETELIVHNKDGKIAWRNSYGNDPYPPPG